MVTGGSHQEDGEKNPATVSKGGATRSWAPRFRASQCLQVEAWGRRRAGARPHWQHRRAKTLFLD
ncbi:hypothetical protein CK203_095511 [Vitis vinifera]|uniref:Uncharacterized protein n=1 Tax=Vitis vinifera TaxID=29760 RepID=A0A438CJC0_VITVI|nr:hypothetical protein CK203_095511 [Vitis vinifera]